MPAQRDAGEVDTPFARLRADLDAQERGTAPPGPFARKVDAFESSVKNALGPLGRIAFPVWIFAALIAGFAVGTLLPAASFMGDWIRVGIGTIGDVAPLIIFFTLTPALVRMYGTASAGKFALYVVLGFILTTTLGGLFALLVSLIAFPFMTLGFGAGNLGAQFTETAVATGEALIVEPVFRAIWGALLMSILIYFGGGYHTKGSGKIRRVLLFPFLPIRWIYRRLGSPKSVVNALRAMFSPVVRVWLAIWRPIRRVLHKVFRTIMDLYTLIGVHGLSGLGRLLKIAMPVILFFLGIWMVTGLVDELVATTQGVEGLGEPIWSPLQAYAISVGVLILVTALWLTIVALAVTAYTKFPLKRLVTRYMLIVYPFAWGTSSSAASLPLNLSTTRDGLGVRPQIRNFVLPIGATANLDGTMMAAVVGTVVAAKMVGVDISVLDFLFAMIPLILITIGTPGVPGGLAVVAAPVMAAILPFPTVAAAVAFQAIFIAILFGPNDMFRTAVNVLDNGMLALLLDKWWPQRFSIGDEVNPWFPVGEGPPPLSQAGTRAAASGTVMMGETGHDE